MSALDEKTLQAYYDQELSEPEAEALRAALADSPDDQQRLKNLELTGELLRARLEAAADEADFTELWNQVSDRIEEPEPASASPRSWLGRSMGAHPIGWVASAAAVVLVAVALAFVLGRGQAPGKKKTDPVAGAITDHLDIESMEFKGRHPDIFRIQDGQRTTTVIWVYPDEDEEDDAGDDGEDWGPI